MKAIESQTRRRLRAGDIAADGAPVLIMMGWAAKYVHLAGARRQLVELLLPGDVIAKHTYPGEPSTQFLCSAQTVPVGDLYRAVEAGGLAGVSIALQMAEADKTMLLHHQVVRLGRLTALERVAHFILETEARLDRVKFVVNGQFDFPMTQEILGDYLGLSTVHVNRTLQHMRRAEWISLNRGMLTVLDRARLTAAAGFDVTSYPSVVTS